MATFVLFLAEEKAIMPLVERYDDWNIHNGSHDDPHTLDFDHRIEAIDARNGLEMHDVEK